MALCLPLLCSCVLDSADNSKYNDSNLNRFAESMAESRLTFPMVLIETALCIEDYEKMSAEEKIRMTYIFENLIKTADNTYSMGDFYGLNVSTDGKSMKDTDAKWTFESTWYSRYYYSSQFSDTRRFELYRYPEDAGYTYFLSCDRNSGIGETIIMIKETEDDEAYFSWELTAQGSYRSPEGRFVEFRTAEPVTRKVWRSNGNDDSKVSVNGRFMVTIHNQDREVLDEVHVDLTRDSVNKYYKF